MPRWIYNRPPENCQATELKFAQFLNDELSDDWIVRWGYWYEDDRGTLREGDFLVLGPAGGCCVFEVKTSLPQLVAGGARWDAGRRREKGSFGEKELVLPALKIIPDVIEDRGISG